MTKERHENLFEKIVHFPMLGSRFFKKKVGNPRPLFRLFSSFQTKFYKTFFEEIHNLDFPLTQNRTN